PPTQVFPHTCAAFMRGGARQRQGPERRKKSMATPDSLRYTRIPLADGSGAIPALGFGTLMPDPLATKQATKTALEVGFRQFDRAERYRNEQAVGDAMQEVIKARTIQRKDIFVTEAVEQPQQSRCDAV